LLELIHFKAIVVMAAHMEDSDYDAALRSGTSESFYSTEGLAFGVWRSGNISLPEAF
jgi:hypothetical protein